MLKPKRQADVKTFDIPQPSTAQIAAGADAIYRLFYDVVQPGDHSAISAAIEVFRAMANAAGETDASPRQRKNRSTRKP